MVDTNKALESDYVTVDLIRHSPTKKLVFIDEGRYEEYEGKDKLTLTVQVDGKTKTYRPNRDSIGNLQHWGTDSKNWIGKVATCRIGKYNGKDLIIAEPSAQHEYNGTGGGN